MSVQREITRKNSSLNKKKEYRTFYLSASTSELIDRVTNTIKIENRKYKNDDAIRDAFKLLGEKHGINQK